MTVWSRNQSRWQPHLGPGKAEMRNIAHGALCRLFHHWIKHPLLSVVFKVYLAGLSLGLSSFAFSSHWQIFILRDCRAPPLLRGPGSLPLTLWLMFLFFTFTYKEQSKNNSLHYCVVVVESMNRLIFIINWSASCYWAFVVGIWQSGLLYYR